MLYKKICFVGLSVYATLSRTVFGATYIEYATDPSANIGSCTNATALDRCEFHCDDQDAALTFNCYNAGTCDVYCEQKKCFKTGGINATNARQLNIYASGDQCFIDGFVYIPSNGSANITVTPTGSTPFVSSTINAGTNTKEIYIHCRLSGACQFMHVNAQTAQLLYIDAANSYFFDGKDANNRNIINCPQSYGTECIIDASNVGTIQAVTINANNTSLYINANGGLIKQSTINVNNASCDINIANSGELDTTLFYIRNTLCTINATNGGSTNNVELHTLRGYPHDVVFENIIAKSLSAKLYCADIDASAVIQNADILNPDKNTCLNSRSPSAEPTKTPTFNPSQTPTLNPSQTPTFRPSYAPSQTPSDSSITPSSSPTSYPSLSPTVIPTAIPTTAPTKQPSSLFPTNYPTIAPTRNPTNTPTTTPTEVQIHVYFTKAPTQTPTFTEVQVDEMTEYVSTDVNVELDDGDNKGSDKKEDSLLYVFVFATLILLVCVLVCGIVVFHYRVKEHKRAAHKLGLHSLRSKSSDSKPRKHTQEGNKGETTAVAIQNVQVTQHKTGTYFEEVGSLSKGTMPSSAATQLVDIDGVGFETAIKNLQAVNNALIDDVVDAIANSVDDGLEVNHVTPGFEEENSDNVELETAGNNPYDGEMGEMLDNDENVIMSNVTMGGLAADEFVISDDDNNSPHAASAAVVTPFSPL